jgi:hypothetical protein
MSAKLNAGIAVIGIDRRGAIVLRQKWSHKGTRIGETGCNIGESLAPRREEA